MAFCYLGKDTMAFLQKCCNVTAWNIVIAVLVASLIVKVGHVGIICHAVIKLYHGVLRLNDIQLREMFLPLPVFLIGNVCGEAICTDQSA